MLSAETVEGPASLLPHRFPFQLLDRVLAVERQDLQRQVGAVALLGEALQLLVHHLVAAGAAKQDGLVEDDGDGEAGTVKYLLAAQPHPDQAGHRGRRDRLYPVIAADDVPRVGLGLQQAGEKSQVPV